MGLIVEVIEQPPDPIGGASGDKRLFNVRCLGKQNEKDFPYTIANEIVAAHIGQSLGLHIPAVLAHQTEAGNEYALIAWHQRVPVTAQALAAFVDKNPRQVHGAIVFDLFVANNDRAFGPQRRNLAIDGDRLFLYDHGNACFYRNRPAAGILAGIPRLSDVERDLAKMFDMAHKENLYFQLLKEWAEVEFWCGRIRELPDFLLEAAVSRIPRFLSRPGPDERERLIQFLVARKQNLIDHIIRRRDLFPNLPDRDANA